MLAELEFFKEIDIGINFTLLLTLLNSPSMVFEMFPFIFLISTQLFFIKLFNNNELEIFKYSGLKNTSILGIISVISLIVGILIIIIFYNFSANLKNFYLEKKSQYTSNEKYLAVITKNGLWIKDIIDEKIYIINSSKMDNQFLIDNFITEFNDKFEVQRNIKSKKINISKKNWKIIDAKVYINNNYEIKKNLNLKTNFDYKRIKSLYSDLSSLNIFQLFELRDNYKKLNYSLTEINLQMLKLSTFPLYLLLITIFSALIMFRIKRLNTTTVKIALGLFLCVIIYYINNFFLVMGSTEKIPLVFAISLPLISLSLINIFMSYRINEK
jgi:lipopolysaccharide export system permease protein